MLSSYGLFIIRIDSGLWIYNIGLGLIELKRLLGLGGGMHSTERHNNLIQFYNSLYFRIFVALYLLLQLLVCNTWRFCHCIFNLFLICMQNIQWALLYEKPKYRKTFPTENKWSFCCVINSDVRAMEYKIIYLRSLHICRFTLRGA